MYHASFSWPLSILRGTAQEDDKLLYFYHKKIVAYNLMDKTIFGDFLEWGGSIRRTIILFSWQILL